MIESTSSPNPLLDEHASRLLDEFILCQVADFARGGACGQAESMLRPLLERVDVPAEALDLQAKICAQQGNLADAAAWWQKLMDRNPSNAAAQAALVRLRRMQRQPVWLHLAWPVAACVAAIGSVALILTWKSARPPSDDARNIERVCAAIRTENETVRQLAVELKAVGASQEEVRKTLATLASREATGNASTAANSALVQHLEGLKTEITAQGTRLEALVASGTSQGESTRQTFRQEMDTLSGDFKRLASLVQVDPKRTLATDGPARTTKDLEAGTKAATVPAPASEKQQIAQSGDWLPRVRIAVSGVRRTIERDNVVLSFDEGLFNSGKSLTPEAAARIDGVAEALRRSAGKLKVKVVGYADDDRTFWRWTPEWESKLALDRARAVAQMLERMAGLKGISATSEASGPHPFPGNAENARKKNRTVKIYLARNPDI